MINMKKKLLKDFIQEHEILQGDVREMIHDLQLITGKKELHPNDLATDPRTSVHLIYQAYLAREKELSALLNMEVYYD